MGIPVRARWWVLTLAIIVILLGISALALNRPDVVWAGHEPHCPHCRHDVEPYSRRCGTCREEFDWVVAPASRSPISQDSLTMLEAEWVHGRVVELGLEAASARLAAALSISGEAAEAYLQAVGRGDCGWCGGTGRDLAAEVLARADPCPCCFGAGDSIACGGDRRVRLGDPTAARALERYRVEMEDLVRSRVQGMERTREVKRLAETFLRVHAGAAEASEIVFWWDLQPGRAAAGGPGIGGARVATKAARSRLDQMLAALRADP